MDHIRIALIGMPPLFGDIVRVTLEREKDMAVVAEFDNADAMCHASHVEQPMINTDVVIAGIPDDTGREVASTILTACPNVRVLTVSTHSGDTAMHELQPRTVPLGDVSPAALVDVIREGAANRGVWQAL